MIKPVFLWTDVLVWLLVAMLALFMATVARKEHLRAPWRRVARSRPGMIAAVILVAYVIVGLLDSVHFHPPLKGAGQHGYSVQVISVLDTLLQAERTQVEETYSAPFATHLYVKEAVNLPDGRIIRVYPRLKYGGAQLKDPRQEGADILVRAGLGFLLGLVLSVALAALVTLLLARRHHCSYRTQAAAMWREAAGVRWRAILATATAIVTLAAIALSLAAHYHIFGTDKVGQDTFYEAVKSIRTGLVIGTLTTLVTLPLAIVLGILAGYFRGWVDDVIQYVYTTLNVIPSVLLIAAAVLIMQVYMDTHAASFGSVTERADIRLLFLCIILGVTSWTGLCRLLRAETLKLRETDYVQAAVAFGVHRARILSRHILPNLMHIVMISVVLDFSGLVLAEAVLSYIGVGVDPSMISWGNMINAARLELARDPVVWWSLAASFSFMFTLVLSANVFADIVQYAFDPRTAD